MKTSLRMAISIFLLALDASAQTAFEPSQLPPDTVVYLFWRGTAAVHLVAKTNPLVASWSDPDFVSFQNDLLAEFRDELSARRAGIDAQLDALLPLLRNRFLFGVIFTSPQTGTSSGSPQPAVSLPLDFSYYMLYDTSGVEELFRAVRDSLNAGDSVTITSYRFRDHDIEKVTRVVKVPESKPSEDTGQQHAPDATPSDTATSREASPNATNGQEAADSSVSIYYRTMLGPLYLQSDSQQVIEDLVVRFMAPEPPTESLAQTEAFRQTSAFRSDTSFLHGFFRMPPGLTKQILEGIEAETSPDNFPEEQRQQKETERRVARAIIQSIALDKLTAAVFDLRLEPGRTRMQTAVLGDTSGGLYSIIGTSTNEFRTLDLTLPHTYSYAVVHLDLAGFYQHIRHTLKEVLEPQQSAMLDVLEGLVTLRTGKRLQELLGLFSEFATVSEKFTFDPTADLYVASLSDSAAVMKLLRDYLGEFIRSEGEVGQVTLFSIGSPPGQPEDKAAAQALFHFAVAPGMLFGAASPEIVRRAAERLQTGAARETATLTANPDFRRVRSLLPGAVSVFSFADNRRVDWPATITQLTESLEKEWAQEDQRIQEAEAAADAEEPPTPEILADRMEAGRRRTEERARWRRILARVHKLAESGFLSRHLGLAYSGCWKRPEGLFCDVVIE